MKATRILLTALCLLCFAGACSESSKDSAQTADTIRAAAVQAVEEAPAKPETEVITQAAAGFDPASLLVSTQTLGSFPYVSLIDGYAKMDRSNQHGSSAIDLQKDVAYDRYEFFDGTKLIPIEGRLTTVVAVGKGASAFQVFKTYESLITGLGGIKVWQGKGSVMKDKKIKFEEGRHRARHNMEEQEEMGIYAVKTRDREVWVEAYKTWQQKDAGSENYWLTVVERKALPVLASVLPAEQMKKELDDKGHVALYINFDTDKASIKPESQPIMEQIVKLLKANPDLKLTVEGHTDNAGKAGYNQQLSENRAQVVVAALIGQSVDGSRLKAAGLGQAKPIADNATEEGKAKNRRVELVKQ